jgi:hypothetical protein
MWFASATKGCKNIEAPIFKIAECIATSDIEVASDARDATEDSKGGEVEIWAFSLPGRYEAVYFIPILRFRMALHKK